MSDTTTDLPRLTRTSSVGERRAVFAQQFGVTTSDIAVHTMDMAFLRARGAFFRVKVSGLTMFEVGASWGDYGVSSSDTRARLLRLGKRRLAPDELTGPLNTFATLIRRTLKEHSEDVSAIVPAARFVTPFLFKKWYPKHLDLVKQFEAHRDEVLIPALPTTITEHVLTHFSAAAHESWLAMEGVARDTGADLPDRVAFVDAIVSAALQSLPSADEVRAGLRVLLFPPAMIATSSETEKELLEVEAAKAAAARSAADQAAFEQMKQIEVAEFKNRLAEFGSPLVNMVKSVEQKILAQVESAQAQMQQTGKLHPKVATVLKELRGMYDSFGANNQELADKLAALDAALETPPEKVKGQKAQRFDVARITAVLGEVADEALASTRTAMRAGSSFVGALDLDDDDE